MIMQKLLDFFGTFKEKNYEIKVTGKVRINGKIYYFENLSVTDAHRYEDVIELEVEEIKL